MKISFIIIVLNGMPFLKAALESIYESAHEIIIIEGAEQQGMFAANFDGSSKDGTVEFIKTFSDPNKKIKLIQGKWGFKRDMQNLALKGETVSGDYIWLVDSDEIYKKEDINTIKQMLVKDPTIYQINFPIIHFWKGGDWILDTTVLARAKSQRIFKMQPPCYFSTHRPPTMVYRNTQKEKKLITHDVLKKQGIFQYHYSYVLKEQVWQKINLYKIYGWEKTWKMDLIGDWYPNCFMKWTPKNRKEIEEKYTIIPCAKDSNTKPFMGTHPSTMKIILENLNV